MQMRFWCKNMLYVISIFLHGSAVYIYTNKTGDCYLLGKGGYVFGSVGLSVCLFVCEQHYSKSYERIGMKFYGRVLSSTSLCFW